MSLSEQEIENLKPSGTLRFYPDGQGLYIAVTPSGEKFWYCGTQEGGQERRTSMGRYPDIGLEKARELNRSLRGPAAPAILSQVAEDWYGTRCAGVDAPKTLEAKRSRLDRLILPELGGRDIRSITSRDVISLVRGVQEARGANIGARVRIILSQIFQYAIAAGLCDGNPAAQIHGALVPVPEARHYAVVRTEEEARAVLRSVNAYEGNPVVRLGLLLLAHTFVRPGEMRLAEWPEVGLDRSEWRIPAARMKMRQEHVVPLSSQALGLFRALRDVVAHPLYCFALPGRDRPMARTMFSLAMRSLGYGEGRMTPHGFRGMASTLLNERGFAADVIERQLAHRERSGVRASYNRAEYMDDRRRMMQWWGDYVEGLMR